MRSKFIYWLMPVLMVIACNDANYKTEEAYFKTADSTTLSSDITPLNSPSRKQIRTADIKCRVANVYNAATQLEQLTTKLDGVVAESRMLNEASEFKEFNYKADSLKRVQIYVPTAYLTLRVPVKHLDSIVDHLSSTAQFINYRTLKQEDATFRYLSNAMKNEPVLKSETLPAPLPRKKSLEATQYADNKRDAMITRRIENLQLLDNAEYATFTVQLFQPESGDVYTVADPSYITRATFITAAGSSLRSGTELLRNITLLFITLWPLWILTVIAWVIYRSYRPAIKKQGV